MTSPHGPRGQGLDAKKILQRLRFDETLRDSAHEYTVSRAESAGLRELSDR